MTVNQSTFLKMESPSLERFLSGRPMVGYVVLLVIVVSDVRLQWLSVFFHTAVDYGV